MKDLALSTHIWRAIESQASAVLDSLNFDSSNHIQKDEIENVNEFELKRLRILIRQLEEESPN